MSTSNTRAQHVRSTVGKIVMVLTFASVIGGLSLVPALGQGNDRRPGQQEHGGYEREGDDKRSRYEREGHDERGRRAYQSYGYSAPLYTPPPIIYDPYPSPGVSLFLPFHFR